MHAIACKNAWTNRADLDQTASEEAVWSGYSLFAIQTNFRSQYDFIWEQKEKCVRKF